MAAVPGQGLDEMDARVTDQKRCPRQNYPACSIRSPGAPREAGPDEEKGHAEISNQMGVEGSALYNTRERVKPVRRGEKHPDRGDAERDT